MKTIYLNRHAKSSWKQLNTRDFDRPLNKRGMVNARFMANKFCEEESVDLLVSSPALRAWTTAIEFAKAYSIPEIEIQKETAIYGAGIREMVQIINSLPNKIQSVMLFGHNPTFTDLAHHLDHDFHEHMVTCARVKVDFEIDDWEMVGSDIGQVVYSKFPRMYPEMENL